MAYMGRDFLRCAQIWIFRHNWGECFPPSSAQAPASAVLSLALILVSPHPPRESRQTWNLTSVGIPEVAYMVVNQQANYLKLV